MAADSGRCCEGALEGRRARSPARGGCRLQARGARRGQVAEELAAVAEAAGAGAGRGARLAPPPQLHLGPAAAGQAAQHAGLAQVGRHALDVRVLHGGQDGRGVEALLQQGHQRGLRHALRPQQRQELRPHVPRAAGLREAGQAGLAAPVGSPGRHAPLPVASTRRAWRRPWATIRGGSASGVHDQARGGHLPGGSGIHRPLAGTDIVVGLVGGVRDRLCLVPAVGQLPGVPRRRRGPALRPQSRGRRFTCRVPVQVSHVLQRRGPAVPRLPRRPATRHSVAGQRAADPGVPVLAQLSGHLSGSGRVAVAIPRQQGRVRRHHRLPAVVKGEVGDGALPAGHRAVEDLPAQVGRRLAPGPLSAPIGQGAAPAGGLGHRPGAVVPAGGVPALRATDTHMPAGHGHGRGRAGGRPRGSSAPHTGGRLAAPEPRKPVRTADCGFPIAKDGLNY